jgi:hypothetical protein
MLPPTALSALGLTSEAGAVNEVLTAALSVDYETGMLIPFSGVINCVLHCCQLGKVLSSEHYAK